MSYLIIGYEVINGSKLSSRPKGKPVKSLKQIDELQKRAENIWNQGKDEEHRMSVYINYVNLGKHNPKSPNLGKHDFKLDKWI